MAENLTTELDYPPLTHIAFVRHAARIAQRSAAWAADTSDVIGYATAASDPIAYVTVKRYLDDMRAALDHTERQIKP